MKKYVPSTIYVYVFLATLEIHTPPHFLYRPEQKQITDLELSEQLQHNKEQC